ncbi:hypothetical protein AB751O23_AP_00050 [Chlamydiales bacterium SCGC AB-751-O23]|jgi:hypothetical protein|nr:hypothetical protein AB751O23_AP_00050 [Chlamydiales bacterium SCGC AB-751-O23]
MFIDILIYTLFSTCLAAILYSFHVFIQLIRLKKNIKKNWSYLDIQFHHRHVLCDKLIKETFSIPDTQNSIAPIEALKKQAAALNKKVEITGGANSPFLQSLTYKEKRLKEELESFIFLFNKAPESQVKKDLSFLIQQICSTFDKEEVFKNRYNHSTKKFLKYQSYFPARNISKKIKLPGFIEIP